MKDKTTRSPLVRISLIFLTVTMLGVTSSWISSCTDSKAAQDTGGTTGDHADMIQRLTRIESQSNDISSTVTTMAELTSKLSDDIGLMSKEIGFMADRIVETEYLIVSVISGQTAAALSVINTASGIDKDPINGGAPSQDPNDKLYKGPALPGDGSTLVLNQILAGHASQNGVLLTASQLPPANANRAPTFTFIGMNGPNPVAYVLLVSSNGTFDMNSQSQLIDANNPVNQAWQSMTTNLRINGNGSKVFYAIKTVNGGTLSAVSNTLNVTL